MRIATIRTVNDTIELATPYVEEFVAALKVSIPHYARKWVPGRKLWIISTEQRAPLLALLARYFDVLDLDAEAQQRQDREAAAAREREQRRQQQEQQHRRWQQEWEHERRQQSREQAAGSHAVLHLLPTAPKELIKAAYLCLAKLYHPDRGGDLTHMQKLNAAYEKLHR